MEYLRSAKNMHRVSGPGRDCEYLGTAMYCRQCDYNLHGLSEQRCPECGRTFDPSDPNTFHEKTRRQRRRRFALQVFLPPIVFLALLGSAFARDPDSEILMMAWLCSVAAAISVVLSLPLLYLGRRRARWRLWESMGFILPFCIWGVWMMLDGSGKSLANLSECFIISLAPPLAVAIRVVLGHRRGQWPYSGILIALLCGVAIATYLLTPSLPE